MRGAVIAVTLAVMLFAAVWMLGRGVGAQRTPEREGEPVGEKVVKTDEEWQKQLSDEEFYVTRRHGTERAFSGRYWDSKEDGVYECVCCGQPLFDSETKYDSGTGWPSFWQPVRDGSVTLKNDRSWFMARTEVLCSRCDAHLGHVFEDGPEPTGQRYCMNGTALRLAPRKGVEGVPE